MGSHRPSFGKGLSKFCQEGVEIFRVLSKTSNKDKNYSGIAFTMYWPHNVAKHTRKLWFEISTNSVKGQNKEILEYPYFQDFPIFLFEGIRGHLKLWSLA